MAAAKDAEITVLTNSQMVNEQLRRSLLVMAPDYSPTPVDDVLAVWLDEPPNEDQANEQAEMLARALERSDRADEATAVRDCMI